MAAASKAEEASVMGARIAGVGQSANGSAIGALG
jgi:hypothetical protein